MVGLHRAEKGDNVTCGSWLIVEFAQVLCPYLLVDQNESKAIPRHAAELHCARIGVASIGMTREVRNSCVTVIGLLNIWTPLGTVGQSSYTDAL